MIRLSTFIPPPEISKECDQTGFCGKLLVDRKVEQIVHDGDDDIRKERHKHKDLDENGIFDERDGVFDVPYNGGTGLLFLSSGILYEQGRIIRSDAIDDHSRGQRRSQIHQQKVVDGDQARQKRRAETAQDVTAHASGGNEGKEAFGLPCIEQIVGQVPEQQAQQGFVKGLENEQDRIDKIISQRNHKAHGGHRGAAEDQKPEEKRGSGKPGHHTDDGTHDHEDGDAVDHVHHRQVLHAKPLEERGFGKIVKEHAGYPDQKEQRHGAQQETKFILIDFQPLGDQLDHHTLCGEGRLFRTSLEIHGILNGFTVFSFLKPDENR